MSLFVILFFMSSGLFLGWSLGANDAANIFGTAVASRMIKFNTAAIICSIFLILGTIHGGAAAHTLGQLGAISALGGAFTVVLSSALSVFLMTKFELPVSSSQAIIGGIVGWNIFAGANTDLKVFSKILSTWVLCPLLAMIFSIILFVLTKCFLSKMKIHLISLDAYTRLGLILAGAVGAYNLGSNGVASVMGVFVSSSPFHDIQLWGNINLTGTQQLFLIGGLAMASGVITYSKKVMMTVGSSIFELSPIAALIAVTSCSLVLFLFSSKDLHDFLVLYNIPPIPLVPVSSSQASVGAVMGIGMAKSVHNLKFEVLGKIGVGWIVTPIISIIVSFVLLFFMQNVFKVQVV